MNLVLLATTIVSLMIASIASYIAWRVVREERRRSEERVAALSDAIYEEAMQHPVDVSALVQDTPTAPRSHRSLMAIGACAVAAVAGITLVAARSPKREPAPTHTASPVANLPLELLALEHERDGNRLVVRGLLRNPANASDREGVTAVVTLYNHDGAVIGSGRAAVPVAKLAAGDTTPFVVAVADAEDVERFRVSFRTGTRLEPHVDHRAQTSAAKEVDR
jgi:hypothetical protein